MVLLGVSNEIQRVTYDGPFVHAVVHRYDGEHLHDGIRSADRLSGATIQAARLQALPNIGVGNVLVTQIVGSGQPLQFDVQFVGTLAQTNLPLMTLTSTAPPQNYVVEFQNLLGFQDVLPRRLRRPIRDLSPSPARVQAGLSRVWWKSRRTSPRSRFWR